MRTLSSAFSFEVTVEADGSDTTEASGKSTSTTGVQVGASFGLGDWTLGVGMRDAEDSGVRNTRGSVAGVTLSGNLGDIALAVSANSDDDVDGVQLYAGFGAFFIEYGQADIADNPDDADLVASAGTTPNSIALGYATSIGRNTTFWAEYGSIDSDGGNDSDEIGVALRYDWN